MALTVEDGTGLAGADSYVSLSDADQYALDHGNPSTWSLLTESQKEEKLRLAAQGLDLEYFGRWLGTRKETTQALEWPRSEVEDEDGNAVDDDSVPSRIQDAQVELALEFATGKSIHASQSDRSRIKSERKRLDVLETETEYLGGKAQSSVASFPKVDRLVARFTTGDANTLFRG